MNPSEPSSIETRLQPVERRNQWLALALALSLTALGGVLVSGCVHPTRAATPSTVSELRLSRLVLVDRSTDIKRTATPFISSKQPILS
jgi:hypothetical protein